MPTVRDATIRLLRDLGITTIFGNPGSTELPMFRDFPEDFRYILGLQESVVVGMADGYALATRNAAMVNLHSSAGTGHALGNIFAAYKNQSPLIVTAGQQARSIMPFEPFLHAERPTEFPRPFVKWTVEPARAQDVPIAIARAYYEAMTPPCGPVFISVPVDDWDVECDWVDARGVATLNPGDPAAIAKLAAALARAKRPAFVLGAGTARDGAWEALIALAEQQKAAVYTAPYASRNVFPEDHPLFGGFVPAFKERMNAMLGGHDFILSMGGPLNLYHAEGFGPHLPEDAECWTVGDNPGVLAWAPVGNAILGNTRAIAQALVALGKPANRAAPEPRPAPAELNRAVLDDRLALRTIADTLPANAIIVEEAPTTRPIMQAYLRLNRPDCFYTTASGGLGYGMPAAVGVSLARPDERVIAIMGDGSAMYGIQSLFSAFQLGSPITFVIINNSKYQALRDFGQTFGMQQVVGTDLSGLDFCALATGHGLPAGRKVSDVAALEQALADSYAVNGPTLIEVMVA
ncbi:benzoylformate decarboxylase [Sphingobium nicotianae]|uniref:Benzoylformate decarboxylase n=1 Tax=Sphingobium nicotianae TaxID=2782607 RepID=A0A9X1DCH0_9SPHN|nr:benzoylformate decarboxylase [Sphingobium nicotianae]MBT2187384.1 benzoylformate decarboxylase [Sphingobium nicotianae]